MICEREVQLNCISFKFHKSNSFYDSGRHGKQNNGGRGGAKNYQAFIAGKKLGPAAEDDNNRVGIRPSIKYD